MAGTCFQCSGPSMEPTIYSDNVLLTERFTPRWRSVQKGDIVIVRCPTKPKQFICKRIMGLEGDKISTGMLTSEVVPRGHVWLEGDNRDNSADSRHYGPIPQALITSRAFVRIYPFDEVTLLACN